LNVSLREPCIIAASKCYPVEIIDCPDHIAAAFPSRIRESACNTGTSFELDLREAHLLSIDGGTNALAESQPPDDEPHHGGSVI
jgi:hypothetical protein